MSTYTYSINDSFQNHAVNSDLLAVEIANSGLTGYEYISTAEGECMIVFANDLSSDAVTLLNSVVANHNIKTLTEVRAQRFAEIDDRTSQLIGAGFEFPPSSGVRYSLSLPTQTKLIGLDILRNDPILEYPVEFNSIDDVTSISIPYADTIHAFYLTACGTVRYHLDSGTALKNQVRAATTIAEAKAVEDNR